MLWASQPGPALPTRTHACAHAHLGRLPRLWGTRGQQGRLRSQHPRPQHCPHRSPVPALRVVAWPAQLLTTKRPLTPCAPSLHLNKSARTRAWLWGPWGAGQLWLHPAEGPVRSLPGHSPSSGAHCPGTAGRRHTALSRCVQGARAWVRAHTGRGPAPQGPKTHVQWPALTHKCHSAELPTGRREGPTGERAGQAGSLEQQTCPTLARASPGLGAVSGRGSRWVRDAAAGPGGLSQH